MNTKAHAQHAAAGASALAVALSELNAAAERVVGLCVRADQSGAWGHLWPLCYLVGQASLGRVRCTAWRPCRCERSDGHRVILRENSSHPSRKDPDDDRRIPRYRPCLFPRRAAVLSVPGVAPGDAVYRLFAFESVGALTGVAGGC